MIDDRSRGRVLIIDDQSCIALAVGCLLTEARGTLVEVATRGEDALKVVREFRPHLVLVDVQMPGMPTQELCRRLREQPDMNATPLYLFTGVLPDREELRALLPQVQGVISKPPDPGELLRLYDAAVALKSEGALV